MVADSIAQMNKLIYGVSDLVKIKRENTMLLGDMNIYRLMTHAQQVEGDKLREQAKENKKAGNGNYDYSQQKSGGANHKALSLREVFQTPTLTRLAVSVVRTI